MKVRRRFRSATLVPDPERAPVVRKAFELCAGGVYTRAEILRAVQFLGLRTRRDPSVNAETPSRILTNPLYAGTIEMREWGIQAGGDFQPPLDEQAFQAAQLALRGRTLAFPCKCLIVMATLAGFEPAIFTLKG